MYNKVILMGRIVNDLELKVSPQGVALCSFRIAVERDYAKKGEERETDFFNVTAWRNTADFICKYFQKGQLIHIDGSLRTRQYTDKNGNPATWYEIVTQNVSFTGDRGKTQSGELPEPPVPESTSNAAEEYFLGDENNNQNEDYPF